MLNNLAVAPPDKIIALSQAFKADPRPEKIDAGVGVYRDDYGHTSIFSAVKTAERQVLEQQTTKAYVGMAGDKQFNAGMIKLVLGDTTAAIASAQTPGGGGALRQLGELLFRAMPDATIHLSDPTWPNHKPIMIESGFSKIDVYPYLDRNTNTVRRDALLSRLEELGPKDIVILHGCCHNPTGAELTLEDWKIIGAIAARRGFLPFVDFAYQGFGAGLEEDAEGVRALCGMVERVVISASCSKNFGLYRDRVGCSMVVCASEAEASITQGQLELIGRTCWSMPPDHGAVVVRTILEDADLTQSWKSELESMRLRMIQLREDLAKAMNRCSNADRFDVIAQHRGMFSLLGLTDEQLVYLRETHGIYAVGGGRINIAGLRPDLIDRFAAGLVDAINHTP